MRNLRTILDNLRRFYEDELGHVILRLPDLVSLAKQPRKRVSEAELLLRLLLGCAFQGPRKDEFVARIELLEDAAREAIKDCVAQVIVLICRGDSDLCFRGIFFRRCIPTEYVVLLNHYLIVLRTSYFVPG